MLEDEKELSPEDLAKAEQTKADATKCPTCGANLTYDPESRGLKCEYCGTKIAIDMTNISTEQAFSKLFSKDINDWGDKTHVVRCNNCGAVEILSRTEITKKCAFCGTTNVVETDAVSGLKPNAVLPFLISKETACTNVITWAKKKVLAPKKFKDSVSPEEVYGNYSPAFTFDALTVSSYDGMLGEYYYVTVKVNGKDVRERRTRWFKISGTHSMPFDDVLIQASSSIKQKTVDKLAPYNTNHSQEYEDSFLQGFSATQYTKDGKQCWSEAQDVMRDKIRSAVLAKYTYDVVQYVNINMNCRNVTYKYLLLPIYVGHCDYRKKIYNVFVNGQTGKVAGKTPLSPVKVGIVVVAALAVLAGIIYLFISQGGNL